MAFVKLDCGILDSTLWPDREAREMFITALLMAEPIELKKEVSTIEIRSSENNPFNVPAGWYGFVPAAGSGIARRAGLETETGIKALERLSSPEPESRSTEFEGRRLVRVNGGFIALNFDKYRTKDHTAAERSKRYRERNKNLQQELLPSRVTNDPSRVASRSVTEAEAEAEAEGKTRNASLLVSEIFDTWNGTASNCSIPKCLVLSEKRRRSLKVRLNDPFFVVNWKAALNKISKSKFCLGENNRGWTATFEWFISPDAVAKIMEGKYDSHETTASTQSAKPKSVFELKTIIEAKTKEATDLFNRHASQGPLSTDWDNPKARDRYRELKKETKELNRQLGSMA